MAYDFPWRIGEDVQEYDACQAAPSAEEEDGHGQHEEEDEGRKSMQHEVS